MRVIRRLEYLNIIIYYLNTLHKLLIFNLNNRYRLYNMNMLIMTKSFHSKNKMGLENILDHLKWSYAYGTENDIPDYDIIYSPAFPIDITKYPNKKFIFGPHFSIFPTNKITQINNIHKNAIYIQPSDWANEVWKHMEAEQIIPIKTFCFPVDTNKFNQVKKERNKVFIYFKRRQPSELKFIEDYLKKNNIEYVIFDYIKRYKEEDYISYLQDSKYGLILGAHESQGFAIEEALACNVPLLVWNTKYMSQEYGSNFKNIPCTSIPYWDNTCGEFFYEKEEFEHTFNSFIQNIESYEPRKYVMEHLSVSKCAERFTNLNDQY